MEIAGIEQKELGANNHCIYFDIVIQFLIKFINYPYLYLIIGALQYIYSLIEAAILRPHLQNTYSKAFNRPEEGRLFDGGTLLLTTLGALYGAQKILKNKLKTRITQL